MHDTNSQYSNRPRSTNKRTGENKRAAKAAVLTKIRSGSACISGGRHAKSRGEYPVGHRVFNAGVAGVEGVALSLLRMGLLRLFWFASDPLHVSGLSFVDILPPKRSSVKTDTLQSDPWAGEYTAVCRSPFPSSTLIALRFANSFPIGKAANRRCISEHGMPARNGIPYESAGTPALDAPVSDSLRRRLNMTKA